MAEFWYTAYRDLSTDRAFEGGPIPHREAMAYADRKGLEPDVTNLLWMVIRRMDQAERGWRIENLKGQTGDG